VSHATKHRFRWTGELVDLLGVEDGAMQSPAADAAASDRAPVAIVRREKGAVTKVPANSLTPVRAPRFWRVPVRCGALGRVPTF
jgi:hypothetical protein